MNGSDDETGFGESFQTGLSAAPPLDAFEAIYRLVLTAYRYRCAVTGQRFAPAIGLLHPDLDVVAIRPRSAGGPLEVSNYLPMIPMAARAFVAGQFLIADDYRLVPDLSILDAHLAALLPHELFLQLPDEALFWPSRIQLAYHRAVVLGP
ncbi:MAG TPA: hypothetical protein VL147_22855 [Devosia sp.]|nr:hypothetical protein [Devosia sp.]